jgi:Flp pilus assembly protein TadG
MRTRELPSQESGTAIVELAFTLPMFLLLILGTAEIANIAWASIQLNNAAHAAAQYASSIHANASPSNSTNIEQAARNEAPALNVTLPTPPALLCSCVTPSTGSSTAPVACTATFNTTCSSPDVILASIQITTQAVVRPLFHYPGLPASYTLHGQATMGVVP